MRILPGFVGRFELGNVMISSGFYARLVPFVRYCLERHVLGDWGICHQVDVVHNNAAVLGGDLIC
jgi:hypothetical protein